IYADILIFDNDSAAYFLFFCNRLNESRKITENINNLVQFLDSKCHAKENEYSHIYILIVESEEADSAAKYIKKALQYKPIKRNLFAAGNLEDVEKLLESKLIEVTERSDDKRCSEKETFFHAEFNQIIQKIVSWLIEPELHVRMKHIKLSPDQKKIVHAKVDSSKPSYRRVKGVAGSGKSLAIAGRAAELVCKHDKQVLVLCYNITMASYLKALIHLCVILFYPNMRYKLSWDNCNISHFHELYGPHELYEKLKLLINENPKLFSLKIYLDQTYGYGDLLKITDSDYDKLSHAVLNAKLSNYETLPTHDACLIDEGQDFRYVWFNHITKVLRKNHEILFVSDPTQNIYEIDTDAVEKIIDKKSKMKGSSFQGLGLGFSGRWIELKDSYRLPQKVEKSLMCLRDSKCLNIRQQFIPSTDGQILSKLNYHFHQNVF
ncbi:MAG: AAA family ATPase, partial [Pontiellaceae bacterium]